MPSTVYVEEINDAINQGTEGGVMMADGNIYCVKSVGSYPGSASIYDHKLNKVLNIGGHPPTSIWSSAGALMSDGRILLFPTGAYAAQIYDPKTNTVQTAGGSDWTVNAAFVNSGGYGAFYSGTLLFDGRVFINGSSQNSSCVVYDPRTNSTIATPSVPYSSTSCCLLPDGKVYRVPISFPTGTTVRQAQIYNPDTNTWSFALGTYPVTTTGFHIMKMLPNGKFFIGPNDASCGGGRIFDPYATSDESALRPTTASKWSTAQPYNDIYYGGATLLPDGRLFVAPWMANKAIIYDYINDTTEEVTVPLNGNGNGLYSGAFTLPNGKVFTPPNGYGGTGRKALLISTYNQKSYSLAALTGPHFNRTY
jgi:WD40 repeat protein